MEYLTGQQADDLFRRLSKKTPRQIRQALAYVEENWKAHQERAIFEYDTDHNQAWYLLGLAYERMGQRDHAARCFLIASEIWPDDADAYVAYSNTEDDVRKQIPILERALNFKDDARIRFNLANALLDVNRPNDALVHLRLVAKIWPDDKAVRDSLRKALESSDPTS